MHPEELSTPDSALSGTPTTRNVDRNPFRSAEFLLSLGQSSSQNPFRASHAARSLSQAPIAQDLGTLASFNGIVQQLNPSLPHAGRTAAGTNISNPSFADAEGFAPSSSWAAGTQERRDHDNGRVDQQADGPVVNIENVEGNVLAAPNYGHVTQTIEEFNVSHNIPVHPDINGHISDCFPGSRSDDEARILQWVDTNHTPELVLCVLGKVGVGKSTLAKQLATRLRQDKRLAAEVFLGFALPNWTPESVVRMAASQLCRNYPTLRQAVSKALDLDVGPSVSLEDRIQQLILEPIRLLGLDRPIVVVLDALDQWVPYPILLKAFQCLSTETHLLRLIVLGRPGLEDCFKNVSFRIHNLLNIAKSILRTYFLERFTQVQWEHGRQPSSQTIDQLVDKADGLFIWSSTLCSVLEDEMSCPKPHNTLTAILQSQQSLGDNDTLASLYRSTIDLRFPKPDHQAKLKVFLGAVLVLQEPLPVEAFASLTSMDTVIVRKIQDNLGPLRNGRLQDNKDEVYPASLTFHLSFPEYLLSSNTPPHLAFSVDTFALHFQLGKACLEELCRIVASPGATFMSPSQKYTMRYWPVHTAHGTPSVSPNSDVEWKATPHFAILDSLSVLQWRHWATLYLQLVHPDTVQSLCVGELVSPQALHSKGTKRWRIRSAIRLLWIKFSHKLPHKPLGTSTHATPQHFISCVTQLLCNGQAGTPEAIAVAEVAVRLQHQSSQAWLELAKVYRDGSQTNASSSLIENAVNACRCAAELVAYKGHQLEVHRMLAICLAEQFEYLGSKEDLYEAMSLLRDMLLLTVPGHPDRSISLNNLANSLQSQYEVTGSTASLEEVIMLNREALSLRPPGHPLRSSSLNNLANSLQSQYEVNGSSASLEEAIMLNREALSLRPPGHPDHSSSLNNLANSLQSQYEVNGSSASLEEAIMLNREALSLRPPGHPDHSLSLSNLAASLMSQYEVTGSTASLEEVIMLNREALSLQPPGHPLRSSSLNNLANSLQSQYEVNGISAILEEAIMLNREALSLRPPGHPLRSSSLNNLANSLQSQYEVTGTTASLEEVIMLNREALSLRPPGHPLRSSSLNNLACSLQSQHQVTHSTESMDEAIILHREALSLRPAGHPYDQQSLSNLAKALQLSYKTTGNIQHLKEANLLVSTIHDVQ